MRVFPWVLLTALCLPAWAKLDVALCGTHRDTAKEELFLHRQSMARRAKLRLAASLSPLPSMALPDAGHIALLEDSDGVVARRNPFTLERRTLTFTPASANASSYTFAVGGDSFDPAAAAAGTPVTNFGDDDSREIALPFAFPYFGVSRSSIFLNSDGNFTFGEGDTSTNERSLGRLTAGPARIAPLFEDLDPSRGGSVRVLLAADRLTVTWVEVPEYSGFGFAPRVTFQVRLHASGRIDFAYNIVSTSGAVTGIAPGGLLGSATILSFANGSDATFSAAVAERFGNTEEIDMATVAQRFYETHGDAYDYLVVYNSLGIPAGSGAVAYESTVRNNRTGYGDLLIDAGAEFGSKSRLQAILNLGPLAQYPADPNGLVPARRTSLDTPLTVLAHEAGHLFLAYASVRDSFGGFPMLGYQSAHWSFVFNSEASLLEGNRIEDRGAGQSPRFRTSAVTQQFSPLDQYLMGLRPAEEVPPVFYVANPSIGTTFRTPQPGVEFEGTRRDVTIDEVIGVEGRRTPDHTVAQRRFRFAFIMVTRAGQTPLAADIEQVDNYRRNFETFFSTATGGRAIADTRLLRAASLSAFPASGVVAGGTGSASIAIDHPAEADLTFTLRTEAGAIEAPLSVVIRAGQSSVQFAVKGIRAGVDDLIAEAADPRYDGAAARIAVAENVSGLTVELVSGDRQVAVAGEPLARPVVFRVSDVNRVPYSGVAVEAAGLAPVITNERGEAAFAWTPADGDAVLRATVGGSQVSATVGAIRWMASPVSAASFTAPLARGALASVFGTNLTFPGRTTGGPFPWPLSLAGVELKVGDKPAQLLYVSPAQVNFLVPADAPLGDVEIALTADGISFRSAASVLAVAPGIFFNPATGFGAILLAGSGVWTDVQPVTAGQIVEVYGTGIASDATATIGGVTATVHYAGLAPGFTGLNQVNIEIPAGTAPGDHPVVIRSGGLASNSVLVKVR